jgi:hypothetical protein
MADGVRAIAARLPVAVAFAERASGAVCARGLTCMCAELVFSVVSKSTGFSGRWMGVAVPVMADSPGDPLPDDPVPDVSGTVREES